MSDDSNFSAFIRSVGEKRLLTGTEEKELARRIAKGDRRASDKLAEHNLRLVISIAKVYARMGFDMEDLVSEGSAGLMKAVTRFDAERGFRFSTYATWWIRQAIRRYISGPGGSTIRVPGRVQKIRRDVIRKMSEKNVSLEEACAILDVDPAEAQEAMVGPRVTTSLDAAVYDDVGEGLHTMIADGAAVDPQHVFSESHAELRAAMSELPERQRRILELRFGFDGPPASRNDTAEELGVSVKVVQQEQARGLATLARVLGTEQISDSGVPSETARVRAVFEAFRAAAVEDDAEPVCVRP